MSAGAITLQCPHCGGVFLTLQHSGVIEICPHCAVGAPRTAFHVTSAKPGVRPRSDLPPVRRDSDPQTASAAPLVASPIPNAPEFPPPPPLPSATPKPESVPVIHVKTSTQDVAPRHAESTAPPSTETPPPAAPATPAGIVSPFQGPAPGSGPTPGITATAAEASTARPPSGTTAPRPVWPGLDGEETESPAPTKRPPAPPLPSPPARRVPWFTLVMLAALAGSIGWLATQRPPPLATPQAKPQSTPPPKTTPPPKPPAPPETRPQPAIAQPAVPPPPQTQAPAAAATTPAQPGKPEAKSTAPPPAAPPSPPPQEVKPALPAATPEQIAAIRARAAEERIASLANDLVKELDRATTTAARLRWLDAGEAQHPAVEKFFAARGGKLEPVLLEPSTGKITLLPSGEQMRLFRLTTRSCPEGAILQFRESQGRFLLRWDLFEQSHERTYDKFVTAGGADARWFTLLCQRAHPFALKEEARDQWICLNAQGSLSASGTTQIYANKDSPVGRYLHPNLEWNRLYLLEVLLGKMKLDGRELNVILDSTAAKTGG